MTVLLLFSVEDLEEAILSFNEFQNVWIDPPFDLSFHKQSPLGMSIKDPLGSTDSALTVIRKEHFNMIFSFLTT